MKKKDIIIYLICIASISLCFKLFLVDFSIPVNSDNLAYVLNGIAHSNGDFDHPPSRSIGWSLFLSPFFSLMNSNDFLDYSNMAKIISIGVSTATIFLVYKVGRKFFDDKYSLVAACLFAFLPQLNYSSVMAFSEPLFTFSILASFYFLLNSKSKFVILALVFAAFSYWIRLNGIIFLLIISITYILTFKKSRIFLKNYGIGLVIFLIIISPMFLQKYEQFGDPFYSSYQGTMFSKNYEELIANLSLNTETSPSLYIENNGILDFIYTFSISGFFNSMILLSKLSFPYLFILIPFGILFSFRAFDQKSQYTKANWIFILSSIFLMSFVLSVIPEKRFLFFLMPFLVLFSVIPIQRVTEYGLSTFSFSRKQKNIFLVIVIIIIIVLSGLFTLRYEKLDPVLENEKIDFAKYALENLHGNTLRDFGGATDYIQSVILLDHNNFQDFKISYWEQGMKGQKLAYQETGVSASNIEDLVLKGELLNLNYLISNQHSTFYYPYIDQVYHNEKQYSYLIKIFDSDEYGYKKLKIKVFEINYEQFHKNFETQN
jgi:hypothetical protein